MTSRLEACPDLIAAAWSVALIRHRSVVVTLTSPPLASVAPGGTRAQGRSAPQRQPVASFARTVLPAQCSCGAAMGV